MSGVYLVVTHSRDSIVPDWLIEALDARGVRGVRVDLDLYPTALDLRLPVADDAEPMVGDIPLSAVRGAWVRKVTAPRLPDGLPSVAADALRRERIQHIRGLFDALEERGARVINPRAAERAIEGNKHRQLRLARAAGLRVPRTLTTNDPDAVRAFFDRCGGEVVVKLLSSFSWSLDRAAELPTRVLCEDDLAHLDELRLGPMCFQERIRAPRELRICWVAGRCFAGAQAMGDDVDWRTNGTGWQPGAVPPDTAAALGRMMDAAGLVTGSIDLMVPDDGPPVFLEVNPQGEWGMLQHQLGLDIAGALADAMMEAP